MKTKVPRNLLIHLSHLTQVTHVNIQSFRDLKILGSQPKYDNFILTFSNSLDPLDNLPDAVVSNFLQYADGAGPEEDLGVAQPPLVVHLLAGLEDNLRCLLVVVLACMNLLGLDDDEPVLEVGVEGPVGEATPADADTLKDTVAGQLENNKS